MKPYFKPSSVELIFGIVLISTMVIIHSCRKDKYGQSSPATATFKSGLAVDIVQLQQIYASAIQSNPLLKTNSGNGNVKLIGNLSVNWNTYTLQKRKDSSLVAEFDMNNDTGVFALKQYRPGDTIRYINKTTAVFIKFNNGGRLNFFTKIIEDLTIPRSKSVIKKMHYNEVPLGFNGIVLYYTFGLTFINGYHYSNGLVDKIITLSATDPNGGQVINSLQTNVTQPCLAYHI